MELGDIGSITLEKKEATIHNGKIFPPHEVIGFTRILNIDEVSTFAKAKLDGVITESDHAELSAYIEERLARLKVLNTVSLFDLGTFTSQDSVVEWTSEFSDVTLPVVSLPQILQSKTTTQVEEVFQNSGNQKPNHKSDKSATGTSFLLPLVIIGIGLLSLVLIARSCSTTHNPLSEPDASQDVLEVAEDDIAPFEEVDSSRLFNHPQLEKYKEVLTSDIIQEGCLIVVGSFKNRENALRMEERVLTEGYTTMIQEDGARSRVIVTFDCLEKDLIEYLQEIKSNVSSQSWFLRPRFEPNL